jgi:hypothetical protein
MIPNGLSAAKPDGLRRSGRPRVLPPAAPLRTVRAPFRCIQLKPGQSSLTERGFSHHSFRCRSWRRTVEPAVASEQATRPGFTMVCRDSRVGRGGVLDPPCNRIVPRRGRVAPTRPAFACRKKPPRYAPGADNPCCHDWGPHQLAWPLPTYLRRPLKSVYQVLS